MTFLWKNPNSIFNSSCEVTSWTGPDPVPKTELLKNIQNKDALFCMLTDRIDSEVLDAAGQNLKVVATMSVGYDHLDLNELKRRNIKVSYTPDVLTDATAELTVALLLATSRKLFEANEQLNNGGWKAWSPFWMCGYGLKNSTVGIVGFGRVGIQVAKMLKGFNVNQIYYTNRSDKQKEASEVAAKRLELNDLLSKCDFVIVTCMATPETANMFNDVAFKQMKKNCIFINTSRGSLVDQDALVRALENKTIAAAGLDVMTPEPLPLSSPLLKLPNCVLLPHIGSATFDTRIGMAELTAKNILCALKEEPMPTELKL